MGAEDTHIYLDQDLTDQLTVNKNLSQEIIVTNTDKVKILINDHHKIIKKKSDWIGPVGIFMSVFMTLLTAKFDEKRFGLDPELWNAIFIIICFASFVISVYFIINVFLYWNNGSVDEFIKKMKNQTDTVLKEPKISIISAQYGANEKFVDVTPKITDLINSQNFVIKSSNDLVDGKDPVVGTKKILKIKYKSNKKSKDISIDEGKTIKIE